MARTRTHASGHNQRTHARTTSSCDAAGRASSSSTAATATRSSSSGRSLLPHHMVRAAAARNHRAFVVAVGWRSTSEKKENCCTFREGVRANEFNLAEQIQLLPPVQFCNNVAPHFAHENTKTGGRGFRVAIFVRWHSPSHGPFSPTTIDTTTFLLLRDALRFRRRLR
jgi:hypothetical protein